MLKVYGTVTENFTRIKREQIARLKSCCGVLEI